MAGPNNSIRRIPHKPVYKICTKLASPISTMHIIAQCTCTLRYLSTNILLLLCAFDHLCIYLYFNSEILDGHILKLHSWLPFEPKFCIEKSVVFFTVSYCLGPAVPHLPGVLVHGLGAGEPPAHHAHHRRRAGQGQVPQVLAGAGQETNQSINQSIN